MTLPHRPFAALRHAYTAQILSWRLGTAAPRAAFLAEDPQQARRTAERILRMSATGHRKQIVLLGAGDGTLAALLQNSLPSEGHLLVLEAELTAARHLRDTLPDISLLADTSPWALLLLTVGAGLTPALCTVCRNPGPGAYSPPLDIWRRLFLGAQLRPLPDACPTSISVACILHPDEPGLDTFFAHIPSWLTELAVVWDGRAPASVPRCPVPLRQRVRPLGGDFSAQRNAMLELCTGEWCLYLDADERLPPDVWATLPRLAALPEAGSVLFPRLTFEGDTAHIRVGYGLWPDVQQRFFRRTPEIRFTGVVHEKLVWTMGRPVLAPGLSLLHYSHIAKNREALEARLTVYNTATGRPTHRLSRKYPCLERPLLQAAGADFGTASALLLPPLA